MRSSKTKHFRQTRHREITNVITFFEHHDIINIEKLRDNLKFFFSHRFRNTIFNVSISFSEFQSQMTFFRLFETFQNLKIFQFSLKKKKFIDKDSQAAKRSKFNNQTSKFKKKYKTKHNTQNENSIKKMHK